MGVFFILNSILYSMSGDPIFKQLAATINNLKKLKESLEEQETFLYKNNRSLYDKVISYESDVKRFAGNVNAKCAELIGKQEILKKFPGTLELMLTSIEAQNKAVEDLIDRSLKLEEQGKSLAEEIKETAEDLEKKQNKPKSFWGKILDIGEKVLKTVECVVTIAVSLMAGPAGIILAYNSFMELVDVWAPKQKDKVRSAILVALAVLESMVNGLLGGCEAITRVLQELKAEIAKETGIISGLQEVSDLKDILDKDDYEKASIEAKEHFTDVCDNAIAMCKQLQNSTKTLMNLKNNFDVV